MTIFWTEERIKTLTKLWLDGVSGEAVAREIGDGCTRNAVIGKANRLGLAAHQRSCGSGSRDFVHGFHRPDARTPAVPGKTNPECSNLTLCLERHEGRPRWA
jgi:GcrA cell cycle regulator